MINAYKTENGIILKNILEQDRAKQRESIEDTK